jgi:hypothetical protein
LDERIERLTKCAMPENAVKEREIGFKTAIAGEFLLVPRMYIGHANNRFAASWFAKVGLFSLY